MNKRGILLVISGPSGSGKSTITAKLRESGLFDFSISATTRKPRPGEENGKDYFFISQDQFEKDVNEGKFLEFSEYVGNHYGTYQDQVEASLDKGRDVILEIEVLGATQIKSKKSDAVLIILLPPSKEVLEERLRNRTSEFKKKSKNAESESEIKMRLERARYELANFGHYDYVIVNESNQLDKAVEDIIKIVEVEKKRTSRNLSIAENFFK